jgi:uncharacterized protein YdeI (YjbR/CyaY-like superfamily)
MRPVALTYWNKCATFVPERAGHATFSRLVEESARYLDDNDAVSVATPTDLRHWLEQHYAAAPELWIGFYKRGASKAGMSYAQALDGALCFGWIDAVRRSLDAERWAIRFTPRKPRSIWSAVNIKRAEELRAPGLLRPAGLNAFEARLENRSRVYAYEQGDHALPEDFAERFLADPPAWAYFQAQGAYYRHTAIWWVISAKREETREKRLATLIEVSEQGKHLPQLTYTHRAVRSRPARPAAASAGPYAPSGG